MSEGKIEVLLSGPPKPTIVNGLSDFTVHRLVDAEACAVQHPALNAVIAATLSEARTVGIEAYDERSGSGELRFVVAHPMHFAAVIANSGLSAANGSGRDAP